MRSNLTKAVVSFQKIKRGRKGEISTVGGEIFENSGKNQFNFGGECIDIGHCKFEDVEKIHA